jgi:hypothetical protein
VFLHFRRQLTKDLADQEAEFAELKLNLEKQIEKVSVNYHGLSSQSAAQCMYRSFVHA